MRRWQKLLIAGVWAGMFITVLLASVLFGQAGSVVDWRTLRAIALQSDDWGLAGFVPDKNAWQGIDRQELVTGHFPEIYWASTLEDSASVAQLAAILSKYRGRENLPAVLQPNYILSALGWSESENWIRYDVPSFPPEYQRPGLWQAVEAAIESGVWYPEFHGTWHYDPAVRKQNAFLSETAEMATKRGIAIFPGSETQARELGGQREPQEMSRELDYAINLFEENFGRPPASIAAPDYTWTAREEAMWQARRLLIIQAKREQRNYRHGATKMGRIKKFLTRRWDYLVNTHRYYLERNCRLEPVQSPDPGSVVTTCVAETKTAWTRGEPAIVETHRVNFSHTDRHVVETGQVALADYLDQIISLPAGRPIFLNDQEIVQLARSGISWRVSGQRVILRNGTHSRRVAVLPGRIFDEKDARALILRGGQTLVLEKASH